MKSQDPLKMRGVGGRASVSPHVRCSWRTGGHLVLNFVSRRDLVELGRLAGCQSGHLRDSLQSSQYNRHTQREQAEKGMHLRVS